LPKTAGASAAKETEDERELRRLDFHEHQNG
jgi:hypothetical protein